MKTKEELNAPKEEVEALNRKLHELTEEDLTQVSGGLVPGFDSILLDLEIPVIEPPSSTLRATLSE